MVPRACIVATSVLGFALGHAAAQSPLPPGFVYLRDIDPTIAQDIRYAGSNNFVGRPLDGYNAAECVLRRDVAMALKAVQADLAPSGRGLKVYDCYRPTQAVRAMVRWARDGAPAGPTKRFYPRVPKTALFALGYLASVSRHSTGTAVDLTMIDTPAPPAAPTAAAIMAWRSCPASSNSSFRLMIEPASNRTAGIRVLRNTIS